MANPLSDTDELEVIVAALSELLPLDEADDVSDVRDGCDAGEAWDADVDDTAGDPCGLGDVCEAIDRVEDRVRAST